MGIYDRDYSRTETPGVQLGGPRMMVTNIVIITCGIYLLQLMFGQGETVRVGAVAIVRPNSFTSFLLLRADLFSAELLTHPWRILSLVTYGFAHEQGDLRHILFNMVGLWFLGREVERRYGQKEFLSLYLTGLVLAGLGWVAVENLAGNPTAWASDLTTPKVLGASGAVSAVVLLFVLNFPKQTLLVWGILPMPAWVLGVIWLLFDINGAYNNTSNVAYTAHLAGAAYGGLYFFTHWSLGQIWPSQLSSPGNLLKRRPRLQVHDPDRYEREINEQVDAVLRKIQDQGQESLTAREKRLLEKASRRYQQKHR